jgi:hypothetical protein
VTSPEYVPSVVPPTANPGGAVRARWAWTAPEVWTERMLTALEQGVRGGRWPSPVARGLLCGAGAVFLGTCPCGRPSVPTRVTPQLESRMRETRQSGSEGGGSESNRFSLPLSRCRRVEPF